MSEKLVNAFGAACRASAPIRNQSDVGAWLPSSNQHSPLALLSPGGRRRLLASLVFRDGFLVGIDTADLEAELSLSQACRVLALFGRQELIVRMPEARVESEDDRDVAAWRAALEDAS